MNNLNKQIEQIKRTRKENEKFSLKRKKRVITITSISAGVLAALTALCVGCSQKGKEGTDNIVPTASNVLYIDDDNINNDISDNISTGNTSENNTSESDNKNINDSKTDSLGNLGTELELPEENTSKIEIGEITGNVDPDKIVEDGAGTIWATSEAENKKDEIGTTTIDDKNGTLELKPDGTVHEKEPSYVIRDEEGNIIETGSGKVPDGWNYDEDEDEYFTANYDKDKYVTDENGNVWLKSDYENMNKNKKDEDLIEGEIIVMDPVIKTQNAGYIDPSSGTKFESKQDWQHWALGDYEYKSVNGVMVQQPVEMDQSTEKSR